MNTRTLVLAVAACALAAPHAAGQAAPGPYKTLLVVETEVGRRSSGGRGALALSWQFGILTNRGRSALGATAYVGFDLDVNADRPILNSRLGVLPRYRRWLSRSASLDFSAGPVVDLRRDAPAAILSRAEVTVGWPNDIALSGGVDLGGGTRPAWFAGVRVGADQVTEVLAGEGIGLVLWGLIRLAETVPNH